MVGNIWRKLFPQKTTRHGQRTTERRNRRRFVPQLEGLETRVLMAYNTVVSLAATENVSRGVSGTTVNYTATSSGANVQVADIKSDLTSYTTVIINNGSGGSENGNITWSASSNLDFNTIGASKTLQLVADSSSSVGAFTLSSNIADSSPGSSDNLTVQVNARGPVTINGSISTGGGSDGHGGARH